MFWILDPYQIPDLQTFSLILWIIFTFLIVFFDTQMFLILMVHFILLLMFLAVISENPLLNPGSQRFIPMFFLQKFYSFSS